MNPALSYPTSSNSHFVSPEAGTITGNPFTVAGGATPVAVTSGAKVGVGLVFIQTTDAAIHYSFGLDPTATSSDPVVPAWQERIISCNPNHKVSFIKMSGESDSVVYCFAAKLNNPQEP